MISISSSQRRMRRPSSFERIQEFVRVEPFREQQGYRKQLGIKFAVPEVVSDGSLLSLPGTVISYTE